MKISFNKNISFVIGLIFIALLSCHSLKNSTNKSVENDSIIVEYPEVYELANIVLALSEYGITDKYDVNKNFKYYDNMRKYFEPYMEHPLLDSINFSRQRWKEFLSFRTDSYAYQFDNNNMLKRMNDFYSFEISEFDDHLALVQDFADESKFREFFRIHRTFQNHMVSEYKNHYMIQEMKDFLSTQFDETWISSKFIAALSPFVGGQNLMRFPDSLTSVSFANIAIQIINDTPFSVEDKSTQIHTLFTEMDHGYINPTTQKFDINRSFNDKYWDNESGYDEYESGVFNEYMTWAVFDIFNTIHFPEFAKNINLNWHFQNDTRGFSYSNLFGTKLKEIYNKYEGKKKIKDLYPEMLEWTLETQTKLSKPLLSNDSDTIHISSKQTLVELHFSEPMEKVKNFDVVLQFGQWENSVIKIEDINNLNWDEEGKSLSFEIELPQRQQYYLLLNYWGVQNPLLSKKGVTLKATSGFVIKNSVHNNR